MVLALVIFGSARAKSDIYFNAFATQRTHDILRNSLLCHNSRWCIAPTFVFAAFSSIATKLSQYVCSIFIFCTLFMDFIFELYFKVYAPSGCPRLLHLYNIQCNHLSGTILICCDLFTYTLFRSIRSLNKYHFLLCGRGINSTGSSLIPTEFTRLIPVAVSPSPPHLLIFDQRCSWPRHVRK